MSTEVITVKNPSDRFYARTVVKKMAVELGFEEKDAEELSLVASELASNLIKYADGGGKILVSRKLEEGREGIEVISEDNGPGIPNVEIALGDGYSTSGSLGYGLGTVNRMMDEFDIKSRMGSNKGTIIKSIRWKKDRSATSRLCPLDVGAATRPHPRFNINGDSFVIKKWGTKLLTAVIDGLGHGQFAHKASQKAREYIENHYDLTIEQIFRGAGRNCRATRGVVMAISIIDWAAEEIKFASIGNIETKVLNAMPPIHFIIRRGIIGVNAPSARVMEHKWNNRQNLLVMHSDGVTSHWKWEELKVEGKKSAGEMASDILRHHSRDNDDATVMVVKGRHNEDS